MPDEMDGRHRECPLCSALSDWEHAMQKAGHEEEDTFLPDAEQQLEVVRDIRPGFPGLQLKQCPECKTYYLYRSTYEFLIGGSEDDYYLVRLSDDVGEDYRAGRRNKPLDETG